MSQHGRRTVICCPFPSPFLLYYFIILDIKDYIYWLSTASLRDLFAVGTYLGLLLSYIYAITCSYIVMSNVDSLFLNPILVDFVYIS